MDRLVSVPTAATGNSEVAGLVASEARVSAEVIAFSINQQWKSDNNARLDLLMGVVAGALVAAPVLEATASKEFEKKIRSHIAKTRKEQEIVPSSTMTKVPCMIV